MHNNNALHSALHWSRRRALRRAALKRTVGEGAPSAEIPWGSVDVNILLSEGADNELETTTLCLGVLWSVGGERQKP